MRPELSLSRARPQSSSSNLAEGSIIIAQAAAPPSMLSVVSVIIPDDSARLKTALIGTVLSAINGTLRRGVPKRIQTVRKLLANRHTMSLRVI